MMRRLVLLGLCGGAASGGSVAILLSGHKTKLHAARSWGEFVVSPLCRDGYDVTIFWCVGNHSRSDAGYEDAGPALAALRESAAPRGAAVVEADAPGSFREQWSRMDDCFRRARRWPAAFDVYLRGRPDVTWAEPLAPAALRADAVSLKFREIFFRDETRVAKYALSVPRFWSTCGATSLVRRHTPAVVERMRDAGLDYCGIVDDQFAVVPARFAAAYFALERGFPAPPSVDAEEAFGEAAGRLPANASRAFFPICYETTWTDVFEKTWRRRAPASAAGPRARSTPAPARSYDASRGHGLLDPCCEFRLQWRLVGRRVPVAMAPFPFMGIGPPPQGDWSTIPC